MRPFALIFILLLILVTETDGQMCRFKSELCHDVGDRRGKCSDLDGSCVRIPGRVACRCERRHGPKGQIGADHIPNT
ncbi:hypothetical protein ACJMK2_004467 [Sinanodonta woodiana]|uniref:Uncharacterized protein n=1 Tax=Sinanodonta woodiana TaxID=1069815 RepID=A0ABD3Y1A4_SINWO